MPTASRDLGRCTLSTAPKNSRETAGSRCRRRATIELVSPRHDDIIGAVCGTHAPQLVREGWRRILNEATTS